MARPFGLRIVTPQGAVVEGEAESLVLPGAEGSLGVLRDHEPWVVLLKGGTVSYKAPGAGWKNVRITGGVADISAAATLVLADSAQA